MIRLAMGLMALITCVGLVLAEEYQGKFKSVEKDKSKITITIDGVDKTFLVTKDPLVVNDKSKAVPKGLLGIKPGTEVKVFTDKKDDKEIATTIKVYPSSK